MIYEYLQLFTIRRPSMEAGLWRPFSGTHFIDAHPDEKYWLSIGLPVHLHRQQIWIRRKK